MATLALLQKETLSLEGLLFQTREFSGSEHRFWSPAGPNPDYVTFQMCGLGKVTSLLWTSLRLSPFIELPPHRGRATSNSR